LRLGLRTVLASIVTESARHDRDRTCVRPRRIVIKDSGHQGFGGVVVSEGGVVVESAGGVVESAGGGFSPGPGVDSGVTGGGVSAGVVGLAGIGC
jgi:hypothetical protein